MNLELMDILEELQWIDDDSVTSLLDYLDSVLEKLSSVINSWSDNESLNEIRIDIDSDDQWNHDFHELNGLQLAALATISRFRKYIWNPSSTRVTNKGSVWDGSFWYRWINRWYRIISFI